MRERRGYQLYRTQIHTLTRLQDEWNKRGVGHTKDLGCSKALLFCEYDFTVIVPVNTAILILLPE